MLHSDITPGTHLQRSIQWIWTFYIWPNPTLSHTLFVPSIECRFKIQGNSKNQGLEGKLFLTFVKKNRGQPFSQLILKGKKGSTRVVSSFFFSFWEMLKGEKTRVVVSSFVTYPPPPVTVNWMVSSLWPRRLLLHVDIVDPHLSISTVDLKQNLQEIIQC